MTPTKPAEHSWEYTFSCPLAVGTHWQNGINHCFNIRDSKDVLAFTVSSIHEEELRQYTARIVACVNYCEGLSNEELERAGALQWVDPEKLKAHQQTLAKLEALAERWKEQSKQAASVDLQLNLERHAQELLQIIREAK